MSKLLTAAALSTAMLAGAAGAGHGYYSSFGSFESERRVPNWQRINNFNPRPITHKNCRKNRMRKRY